MEIGGGVKQPEQSSITDEKTQECKGSASQPHEQGGHRMPIWRWKRGGKQAPRAGATSERTTQEAMGVRCAEIKQSRVGLWSSSAHWSHPSPCQSQSQAPSRRQEHSSQQNPTQTSDLIARSVRCVCVGGDTQVTHVVSMQCSPALR